MISVVNTNDPSMSMTIAQMKEQTEKMGGDSFMDYNGDLWVLKNGMWSKKFSPQVEALKELMSLQKSLHKKTGGSNYTPPKKKRKKNKKKRK